MNYKKAEKHSSTLLQKLMAERNPKQTARVRTSMLLAAKIDDAMKAKGMNKIQLAHALGKQPSVITKWLSGTHNFTSDTLTDIGNLLGIQLFNLEPKEVVVKYVAEVQQPVSFVYEPTTIFNILIEQFYKGQKPIAHC